MNTFLGSSFLGECNKCTPLQHIKGGLFLNWGKTHKKKLERFEIGIDNSPGATISVITIIISALQRVANSRISKTPLASAHATLFFFFFCTDFLFVAAFTFCICWRRHLRFVFMQYNSQTYRHPLIKSFSLICALFFLAVYSHPKRYTPSFFGNKLFFAKCRRVVFA